MTQKSKTVKALQRQLEIEAALERVRARSMAMQSSDELSDVLSVLFQQFDLLGIAPKTAWLSLWNPDENTFSYRSTGTSGLRIQGQQVLDIDGMAIWKDLYEKWKADDSDSVEVLYYSKNDLGQLFSLLEETYSAMPEEERLTPEHFPDGGYSVQGHCKYGYIGYTHTREPSEEDKEILTRFATEFGRVYQRFLDIERAEAQAREAQIETALERIRARSMAMHKTDELQDVINTVYQQFLELKVDISGGAFIAINSDMDSEIICWGAGGTADYVERVHLPFMDMPIYTEFLAGIKKGPGFFTESFTQKEKEAFLTELFKIPPYNKVSSAHKKEVLSREGGYTRSCCVSENTSIFIINHHGRPFSEEENDILRRIGKVFEQTYTRFLDLQKAEAQARQAEIEAAIERVRASSMAMHSSSELYNVINILTEQLAQIGIEMDAAMINEKAKGSKDWFMWLAIPSVSKATYTRKEQVHVPYLRSAGFDRIYRAYKEGKSLFSDQLSKAQKDLVFRHYFKRSNHRDVPKARQDYILSCPGLSRTTVLSKNSFIQFYRYSLRAFSEEENQVLERFGQVFDQSYTRFLDLQKAEAQAREAQIEASLERVRSRSMGMQASSEMQKVADEIHDQLVALGIEFDAFGMSGVIKGKSDYDVWIGGQNLKEPLRIPYNEATEVQREYNKVLRERPEVYKNTFSGQEMEEYFDFMRSRVEFSQNLIELMQSCHAFTTTITTCKNSSTQLVRYSDRTFTDEENEVLNRFGKVFEQAYIRFLDLQKSETQAREARIETSLERIRARTMAMQESAELTEVLSVIFQQLKSLGVDTVWTHLTLVHLEENAFTYRMTGRNGERIMAEEKISLDASEHWAHISDAIKSPDADPEPITRFEVPPEGLDAIWELFDGIFSKLPEGEKVSPGDFPDGLYTTQAYCKFGFLGLNQTREATREEADILLRFTTEFSRLYQRFLDLQNAERRAREAQIEAALERVRARSMAMHKTEELADVLCVLLEQFDLLGVSPVLTHLTLFDAENETFSLRITTSPENRILSEQHIDVNAMEAWKESFEHWKNTEAETVDCIDYTPEMLPGLFDLMDELIQSLPKKYRIYPEDFPEGLFTTQGRFDAGFIGFNHTRRATEEEKEIVRRLAAEFGRVYQRFLDLQKAEAQAREAQIEAALERVRAKTMAMHNSQDVGDTVITLFQEVMKLGLDDSIRCGIGILEGYEGMETWSANSDQKGKIILKMGMLNMSIHPMLIGLKKAWQKGDKAYSYHFAGADVTKYYKALNMEPEYPIYIDLSTLPENQFANIFFFTEGILFAFTQTQLTQEARSVLKRFASVFGQTYRRYLDLLKAEAQAREAQIEAALERVRAKTMAMHRSEELSEVAAELFRQIDSLGATPERLNIGIVREEEGFIEWWSTKQGGQQIDRLFKGSIEEPTTLSKVYAAWKAKEKSIVIDQTGQELQEWIRYVTEVIGLPFEKDLMHDRRVQSAAYFKHGALLVSTREPIEREAMRLLERFAGVFEQTYTRFLDLQKAEQQAREAEIEAALERVRAKTMAMHNTDDIADTVIRFFEELLGLGLDDSMRVGIGILSPSEQMKLWTASVSGTSQTILHSGFLDMTLHPLLQGVIRAWKKQDPYFTYLLKGEDLKAYFRILNDVKEYPVEFDLNKLPESINHRSIPFADGVLFLFTESPLPEDIIKILERFTVVFGQTYTRYLDLQKAERRTRESRIEAALERVRAKALAMHSSEDLRQTITTIFEELDKLEIQFIRLGLGLLNPDKPEGEIVTSRIGENGEIIEVSGNFLLEGGHPVLNGVYKHFKKQLDYFPILEGDQIDSYYAALTGSVNVEGQGTDSTHYGCFLYFPEGCLYAWANQPHSEAQIEILEKFSRVVEITYRRYNDLIESEAREKEAIKQASLDRVRAEIASMRTAEDLERITPLIWKELTTLGIPFFRCGVFIMDEAGQMVHVYLTTPDGEALAVMDLPFDFDMPLIQKGVAHWRKQESLVEEWNQKQFVEMTKKLMEHGQVKSAKSYQAGEKPPARLVLHQVPFSQGMLYVGSAETLSFEEMDVVQALAKTFAVAYARYEDFKELEKAKKKVENTLADLKATQAQLIQSEKMASLGELTAGIAHEIKNPLNFVNNFSEVSRELLEELLEEMENGDSEEVRALAGDVIQNLEKIIHHGQRADSIVKGMLQHSRSGDGKKEPTDLNELADEYLRLAYHGLRAKDKSFNATMETDYDDSLGKVTIVPQDIGRVLLNLLTNAFHAVSERKSSTSEGYDPTVWVQTKKTASGVEISVRDNGGGIPHQILDKIFQPFFTTKPTGQGTGLGLSLSYDIVKAHGGELKVETKEGDGTSFYINFKRTS